MKIHAYRIDAVDGANVMEVLDRIAGLELEERFFDDDDGAIRLEHLEQQDGMAVADFVKRRNSGPGHLQRDRPISGFDLDVRAGDSFGEETAIIFDFNK